MDWSYQLYSSRNAGKSWPEIIKELGKLGYKKVEGFGGVYEEADAVRAALDEAGMTMPTGHFSIDMLENDFPASDAIAEKLGIKIIACPFIGPDDRPTDATGWRNFGARLAKIGTRVEGAGHRFAWHNHHFEFEAVDGTTPMALILQSAPEIGWEMDLAWVVRGHADPAKWIADHADRIVAVHVKDIAPEGQNADEDGWADVGHGTVDWKSLYKLLRDNTPAEHYVMEHDKPSDAARFAKRSIEAASKF
ncbi:MAG TPA: sugar phosphate isomerase/epimerase [Mesorhizobium sp.]|jgi:sugar phosphate isomerase/epimerase